MPALTETDVPICQPRNYEIAEPKPVPQATSIATEAMPVPQTESVPEPALCPLRRAIEAMHDFLLSDLKIPYIQAMRHMAEVYQTGPMARLTMCSGSDVLVHAFHDLASTFTLVQHRVQLPVSGQLREA